MTPMAWILVVHMTTGVGSGQIYTNTYTTKQECYNAKAVIEQQSDKPVEASCVPDLRGN